jgi:eukaryotic-like serine/threonine-protein kinase
VAEPRRTFHQPKRRGKSKRTGRGGLAAPWLLPRRCPRQVPVVSPAIVERLCRQAVKGVTLGRRPRGVRGRGTGWGRPERVPVRIIAHTVALTPGSRLGVYEVTVQIGEGGMGQVFRARDTKLNRDVALKVLPDSLASDADRLARFTREAQLLASLNHPHIAAVYGLEEYPSTESGRAGGGRALVMELVEGGDLSQRIARGAIPVDEALPIAKQIAEALEAAHEQGIVHRDLKPANIKVRPDGTAKVLDFGLAKAMDPSPSSGNVTQSPTITAPAMTRAGIILGTAPYMAPEQARGQAVDKRADIWAFGCVVYEMLTGQRAFKGEQMPDVLAAVLRQDLDWGRLPAATSPRVRRLLVRCLDRDPRMRLRDIGEARVEIEKAIAGVVDDDAAAPPTTSATSAVARRRTVAIASAALLVGAAGAALATWALMRSAPMTLHPMRFAVVPPVAQALSITANTRHVLLSGDGTHLVYVSGNERQLLVRPIGALDAIPLPGTTNALSPFLSPDGRWVGFFTSTELRKVSIAGGPPVTLCPIVGAPRGASWGPDDTILFATADSTTGLLSIAAVGGQPAVLTTPTAQGEDHLFPSILPGGRAALFTVWSSSGGIETAQVAVRDLATGRTTTLIRGGSQAEYVAPPNTSESSEQPRPGRDGYLVYAGAGTLHAVRFDPVTLAVGSNPVLAVEAVTTKGSGAAEFSVSRTGALVYVPGGAGARSLVWVTRDGREEPVEYAPPRAYQLLRLSPDGTRVALDIRDPLGDIWILDLVRQTLTRLTDSPAGEGSPVWTPDSRRVLFASSRTGVFNIYAQAANNTGTVERLTTSPNNQFPDSISPDGARLVLREDVPTTGVDLRVLLLAPSTAPVAGPSAPPGTPSARHTEALVQTTFTEAHGELSPDGHWLAYVSNESGRNEVFVRPFPTVDAGRWTISTSGGSSPVWARRGTELFYRDATGALNRVPIRTAPTFSASAPTRMFETRYYAGEGGYNYGVSPDGQRFLMIKAAGTDQTPSMIVVLNWLEELRARLPLN